LQSFAAANRIRGFTKENREGITSVKNWAEEITSAKSLEELWALLREACAEGVELYPDAPEPECRVDIGNLPVFGGNVPPAGIAPIWSWDRRSLLIGKSFADLRIMSRKGWRRWMQLAS
jgi:hypothetical protein